jgi:hypothetical protein
LLHALPYAKRLELERREGAGLRESLAGLALLVLGAARIRAPGLAVGRLAFTPGAKPRCHGGPHFSISHTRARVVCAISETVDPGVDVESVARGMSTADRDRMRRWTATEAALKAAGLGLRDSAGVRLDPGLRYAEIGSTRYVLSEPRLAEDCICHVAMAVVPPELEIDAVDLDAPEASLAIERSLGVATQLD